MGKILVTGANGFVVRHLCRSLYAHNLSFRAAVWNEVEQREFLNFLPKSEVVVSGDIGPDTNWDNILCDIDTVVHLAVHGAHSYRKHNSRVEIFNRVNVQGTRQLALSAERNRIKKFIYLGSFSIYKSRRDNRPIKETDIRIGYDNYSQSKLAAVHFLEDLMSDCKMQITVLHPPLIYGTGSGALLWYLNMIIKNRLIFVDANQRKGSLIFIDNLVSAIARTIKSDTVNAKSFLVADYDDITALELLKYIATLKNVNPRIIVVPSIVFKIVKRICRSSVIPFWQNLSRRIDCSKISHELAWQPPFTLHEGIAALMNF